MQIQGTSTPDLETEGNFRSKYWSMVPRHTTRSDTWGWDPGQIRVTEFVEHLNLNVAQFRSLFWFQMVNGRERERWMRNLGTKGLQAGRWAFGWVFLKKYQTKWPHNTRSPILTLVNTSHGQNLPGAAGVLLILEYMICSRHHKPQECYHLSEQYVSQPNNQARGGITSISIIWLYKVHTQTSNTGSKSVKLRRQK